MLVKACCECSACLLFHVELEGLRGDETTEELEKMLGSDVEVTLDKIDLDYDYNDTDYFLEDNEIEECSYPRLVNAYVEKKSNGKVASFWYEFEFESYIGIEMDGLNGDEESEELKKMLDEVYPDLYAYGTLSVNGEDYESDSGESDWGEPEITSAYIEKDLTSSEERKWNYKKLAIFWEKAYEGEYEVDDMYYDSAIAGLEYAKKEK